MHRPPHFVRRSALGMLAAWPLGVSVRRANAASPAERLQAEALARAEFTDAQGTPHWLSELTRPLVLVNLWAAWCAGCLEELPTIRALAAHLGPDAIDVVLLSHEMNWNGDMAYAHQAALPFRHWRLSTRVPETAIAAAFRIEADRFGLPQSLVFAGRSRILVRSLEGSNDWAAPGELRLARRWLEVASQAG